VNENIEVFGSWPFDSMFDVGRSMFGVLNFKQKNPFL